MMKILKLTKRLFFDIWLVLPRVLVDFKSARKVRRRQSKLFEDGYLVLPVVDANELIILNAIYKEQMEGNEVEASGQLTGRIYKHGLIDSRLAPIVKRFEQIAADYLDQKSPNLELTYFQRSIPQITVENIPGGEFHIDDVKANIKFFIYLNDVTEKNGPFKAVPGSHRWNEPQRLLRAFWHAVTKSRSSMYLSEKEHARLEEQSVAFLGVAGTCFVVDTTAWHAASAIVSGERRVFVASYNRG